MVTRDAHWIDNAVSPLASREFEEIRELAHRAFGLDLKHGKEDLVSARLQRLVRSGGFRSYREYCRHVRSDSTGESLMALIDALATNHTSFLREADHYRFLRERVAPELARRPSVDVWSAACSTGEEVWTLVLLLRDALPGAKLRVLGSDISRKALRQAANAMYPAERVASLPRAWLEAGFIPNAIPPDSFTVKPVIRECATFRRVNLIEPFPWTAQFPVIFCRNVMIYFDRPTQKELVRKLSGSLESGGYLFVGHAESLSGLEHGLEYVRPAVYRKPVANQGGSWNGSW
jgi:chemotaxis protein methyltransferase CheR